MWAPAWARRLIDAGRTLTVYNRTRSRTEPFRASGVNVADTVRDAAANADVLISMVADDQAVEEVVFPPGDVLHAMPSGAVHTCMSTISVALSRRLADAHRECRQHYVAAPVFGRSEAAASGKVFVVAAGCRPAPSAGVLTGSLFSAPIYRTYGNILLEQKFDPPGFKLPLGMKDNTLVLEKPRRPLVCPCRWRACCTTTS